MAAGMCPKCKKIRPELIPVDVNVKTKLLAETGQTFNVICAVCLSGMNRSSGKGVLARQEQQKITLWRNRVGIIKNARDRFAAKDFGGAVVGYEKYFKVLEVIYEKQLTEITHKDFGQGRQKEMTVVCSALWDLIRIYDQNPAYRPRLEKCITLLIEYLPHTPLYTEISTMVHQYKVGAKNRDLLEKLGKKVKKIAGRCFIATAAYTDPKDPVVVTLSEFRDEILQRSVLGRSFIKCYYTFSPSMAFLISRSEKAKSVTRKPLKVAAKYVKQKFSLKTDL